MSFNRTDVVPTYFRPASKGSDPKIEMNRAFQAMPEYKTGPRYGIKVSRKSEGIGIDSHIRT